MEQRRDDDALPMLASSATAGAVAELMLGGGPIGVLAGALVPVAVQTAGQRLARSVANRWTRNSTEALTVAAGLLDAGLEIFDERLASHDERVELLARVIEGSARATLPAKIRAFGRVLAEGLSDDGDVDEALLLASALAAIEAPHVAVLQHLAAHPQTPPRLTRPGIESSMGWRADQLAQELPRVAEVTDALLAVLAGQGLIRDTRGTSYEDMDRNYWQIAPLGRRCLFLLDGTD